MSSPKNHRFWLLMLLALLAPPRARAQTSPAINGLTGDYYEGIDFEKYVLTRRDATIDFDWGHQAPAPGMPAEQFSVRWMGWLVPPASGEYTFHVTVDDGIRLWLNDKLLLNEWRGQPLSFYTATVTLRAGEPYRLRVDYCQYRLDTRVFINWELPPTAPSSWRNLWGLTSEKPTPKPIPTEFLFRANPRLGRTAPPAPKPVAAATVRPAVRRPVAAAPASSAPPTAARRRAAPTVLTLVPVSPATPLPRPALPPVAPTVPADTARLARLAVGESLTLPDLFFEQGKAGLLPGTRAALDKIAAVLSARPGLRLEVQGHTDNVGSAELNRLLSQQRAESVCLYLRAHGVSTAQLQPMGYGGTQPVADNADNAQRPRNRRVVLRRL